MTEGNGSVDAVVIERDIDAPVELVWKMWTDAHHFAAWYGPTGATIVVAEMDVRVGGTRRPPSRCRATGRDLGRPVQVTDPNMRGATRIRQALAQVGGSQAHRLARKIPSSANISSGVWGRFRRRSSCTFRRAGLMIARLSVFFGGKLFASLILLMQPLEFCAILR